MHIVEKVLIYSRRKNLQGEIYMTKAEQILQEITSLYRNGEKEKADKLYNEEYIPLIRKENNSMKRSIEKFMK